MGEEKTKKSFSEKKKQPSRFVSCSIEIPKYSARGNIAAQLTKKNSFGEKRKHPVEIILTHRRRSFISVYLIYDTVDKKD